MVSKLSTPPNNTAIASDSPPSSAFALWFTQVYNRLAEVTSTMGGVLSFKGRTGDVLPAAGDYADALVSNTSGVTGATVKDAINTLNSGKQGAIVLTTLGSGGPATLSGNALNIPQYTGGGGTVTGALILGEANASQILSNVLSYVGEASVAYF